jgi:hypothetical protein
MSKVLTNDEKILALQKEIAKEERVLMNNEIIILQKILEPLNNHTDPQKRMQIVTEFFHRIVSQFYIFQKIIKFNEPFRTSISSKIAQLRIQGEYFQTQYKNAMNRPKSFTRPHTITSSQDDRAFYKELVDSYTILEKYMSAIQQLFP